MEFYPVIFAAGKGTRMPGMTSVVPKHLLPVANRPLIRYPLEMVAKAGFDEVLVVTSSSTVDETKKCIAPLNLKLKVEVFQVPDQEDWGTVDSLKSILPRCKAQNILLMGCDIITTVSLQAMADVHRRHDAALTCLLRQGNDEAAEGAAVPGPKSKRLSDMEFIGLDGVSNRILIYASEADLDEVLPAPLSMLKRYPFIELHTDLVDSHLYMMNREVVAKVLVQFPLMKSVRCELVPHLAKAQYRVKKTKATDILSSEDAVPVPSGGVNDGSSGDGAVDDGWAAVVRDMSSAGGFSLTATPHAASGCFAFFGDDGDQCIRVNTVAAYMEANRLVVKNAEQMGIANAGVQRHQCLGSDSLAAEDVQIGDKSSIKKSVIGAHCKIGEKVKIINSVLMDFVTIKEGCTINGCFIGEYAEVQEKCDLKECIVGRNQTVLTLSKLANEELTGVDMIEI